jgi:hypothetical protein
MADILTKEFFILSFVCESDWPQIKIEKEQAQRNLYIQWRK